MAYRLEAGEGVGAGVKRCVRRELESAIEQLHAATAADVSPDARAEAIHDARRCFKRARAALRLVRDGLGNEAFREHNGALRDAARVLSTTRDATVLAECAAALAKELEGTRDAATFAQGHDALVVDERAASRRLVADVAAFDRAAELAQRALARVPTWTIAGDDAAIVEAGVRRVYRAARGALAAAGELPTTENVHELRKQSKYLWHLLELLERSWIEHDDALGGRHHALSRLLGEAHDLALLRAALAADASIDGALEALRSASTLVARRHDELCDRALATARALYREKPKAFAARCSWSRTSPCASSQRSA